jgi:signal transduction histidine kinase
MTTVLKISNGTNSHSSAMGALRDAGVGVIEVGDWDAASEALRDCASALVVCDDDALGTADSEAFKKTLAALGGTRQATLAPDMARTLSHELRTPLSAMAGWLHLMESGKLDDDAMKRAIQKLRGNIDDQVRTIERYLGSSIGRS